LHPFDSGHDLRTLLRLTINLPGFFFFFYLRPAGFKAPLRFFPVPAPVPPPPLSGFSTCALCFWTPAPRVEAFSLSPHNFCYNDVELARYHKLPSIAPRLLSHPVVDPFCFVPSCPPFDSMVLWSCITHTRRAFPSLPVLPDCFLHD